MIDVEDAEKSEEHSMTAAVQNLVNAFNGLSEVERHEATVQILQSAGEHGNISDAALCEIADELFQAMDRSEADDAKP
jgi:hypothetical protein